MIGEVIVKSGGRTNNESGISSSTRAERAALLFLLQTLIQIITKDKHTGWKIEIFIDNIQAIQHTELWPIGSDLTKFLIDNYDTIKYIQLMKDFIQNKHKIHLKLTYIYINLDDPKKGNTLGEPKEKKY